MGMGDPKNEMGDPKNGCVLLAKNKSLPQKCYQNIVQYSNSVKKCMLHRNILFRNVRIKIRCIEEVLEYKS